MNFIRQIKMRLFLIVFILSFTIIPIIASTFFSFVYAKNTIRNNYNQNYVASLFSGIKSDLSLILSEANNLGLQLNISNKLIHILNTNCTTAERENSLRDFFQLYTDGQNTFLYVDYITPDQNLIHISPASDLPNIIDTEYLAQLKRSKFTLSSVPQEINGTYFCMLGKQLYNYQKSYALGTLILYVDQELLNSTHNSSEVDSFFISLDKKIISHTSRDYIGSTLYIPDSVSKKDAIFSSYGTYTYYEDNYEHESLANQLKLSALLSNDVLLSPFKRIMKNIFISMIVILLFTIIFVICISQRLLHSFINLQLSMDAFISSPESFAPIPVSNELAVLENTFNNMANEITSLIKEVQAEKDKQALAEIKALQSQINPHFLYNALGAISWKAKINRQYEIDDMVIALSTFFRIGLHKGADMITVAEEIDHLKSYLEIETIRFPDLFDIIYDVDTNTLTQIIPKIILQPIVENSITHGFRNKGANPGLIQITICPKNEELYFEIKDNGTGFESIEGELPKSTSEHGGYGLYNVNERLIRYYGANHQLHIYSTPGTGTKTYFTIPIKVPETE